MGPRGIPRAGLFLLVRVFVLFVRFYFNLTKQYNSSYKFNAFALSFRKYSSKTNRGLLDKKRHNKLTCNLYSIWIHISFFSGCCFTPTVIYISVFLNVSMLSKIRFSSFNIKFGFKVLFTLEKKA